MKIIELVNAKVAELKQKESSGGGYFNGKISAQNPTGFNLTSSITQPSESMKKAAREIQITIPSGYTMPIHYLTPMTREQINEWLGLFFIKKKLDCEAQKGQFCGAKAMAYMYIELMNLAYVNGFATYDQLQAGYKESSAFLADVPEIPSFKEQLKNAGKVLAGGVAGFMTGGPVGLFVGIAGATGKIVADQRLARQVQLQKVIEPQAAAVTSAQVAREQIAQEQQQKKENTLWLLLLAVGAGIAFISLKS